MNKSARFTHAAYSGRMTTALITGASAGLGEAFARAFASRGDDVILVARDGARLSKLAMELRQKHNVDIEIFAADLIRQPDLDRIIARLEDPDNPVDWLINNAGFGISTSLLNPDTSEHIHALDVMAKAPLLLASAAGRAMKARGRGHIVTVSSLSAWLTSGDYSAVKSYALITSEALANELDGSGVTVTALCPGWVRTEFHERANLAMGNVPPFIWVSAERCVRECLRDARAGKTVSIPTLRWKLAHLALGMMPRSVIRKISKTMTKGRN